LVFEPFSFLFAFFIIFFAFFISFFAFFISFFASFDLSFLATASSRAALQTPAIYHALRTSSGSFAILAAIRLASSLLSKLPPSADLAHPQNERKQAFGRCRRASQKQCLNSSTRQGGGKRRGVVFLTLILTGDWSAIVTPPPPIVTPPPAIPLPTK
jgi:hypothetical protein